ncbi:MAG: secondary thiamine-phosphate synthase enzyme YjbQ [Candidatus Thermoplasmatota archaeon]|nr:secondary thiamine-phosphate synthase enzyme YjbQ [Candidatus Thermoplasmatota archaeon]MBU1941096.1 secondary thiamine-phosphate synthase enzyme YjbQ [Candidatus Thermoplasmatota archaeon]
MKQITIQTRYRSELIDITDQIQQYIIDLGLITGFVVVYVPHTTAGVIINEGTDQSVQKDLLHFLDRLVPPDKRYHHAEGNSDAHIKASIIESSVTIILEQGKLVLGT